MVHSSRAPKSLVPVLEMLAGTYATSERPSPEGPAFDRPDAWHRYWADSLADAGITGLVDTPVASSLVSLDQLTPAILRVVLAKEFADTTWDLDDLGPLTGGYLLRAGTCTLRPGCCGDLTNLNDWRQAAEHTSEAWAMLWIGHPWSHVRATADVLHLAEPCERTDTDRLVDALTLSRAELRDAVAAAARVLDRFEHLLLPLVEELRPRLPAGEVVRVLLRGHTLPEP